MPMMQPTLIDIGKTPDEAFNAKLLLPLPVQTPYGNLTLKWMKLVQRLDEANRRITESAIFWEQALKAPEMHLHAYERHVYANEQAIYLIRRAADELIALIWLLSEWKTSGNYPSRILVDSIGVALRDESKLNLAPISKHNKILKTLNEISNAFKHSFINSDLNIAGAEEPCVHALALDYNHLKNRPEFHNISMKQIALEFSDFYKECVCWLLR
jgi:hypothetical protein